MGTQEPPGRRFPAHCGTAWGGYGAAWAAWAAPSRCPRTVRTSNRAFQVFTRHETRITAFFRRRCARDAQPETPARTAAHAARSLLSCALWRGMGRLWCGMGGPRPPCRQHGLLGFRQPRITQHVFPLPLGTPGRATPSPADGFFTKHETRIRAFSPWVRKGRTTKTAVRTLSPPASHFFLVRYCSRLFTIVRYCSALFGKKLMLSQCPRPVLRSRWASRRTPMNPC